ncbi:hypothetical protein PVAP13_2KG115832 [Panicum virgatum]|uniref:Uncharacterized protein n=1 Tax=Panicum virgatum TaxID=38727 RepID=A0A8T0VV25_PANVG|nr:hypothetical protein PVAP13_2KG115832 [Panicum virgatum]
MPRRGKASKPRVRVANAYERLPLPSGVPVPMCFCGDPFKRYWMCSNYAFEPSPQMICIGLMEDKEWMEKLKGWDAEREEWVESRCKEEAAEKEREAEMRMRHEVEAREVREKNLECARRAKAAMEENPVVLRKGKWPCCTQ